jgi:hypothetical protein
MQGRVAPALEGIPMGSSVPDQYVIKLEDGQAAVIAESQDVERLLRARLVESKGVRTRVSLRDTGDTEGHSQSNVVAITLEIEGDVEGHAFSLRFPTADAARDFEKRMLATGLLVGTIAATAVGIGVGQGIQSTVSQLSQPAPIVQAGPATRDMDKLSAPIVQTGPATRDMDKLSAPIVQTGPATRDMDKLSAPIVQTGPATRDMDKLSAPIAPPATRDMDKLSSPIVQTGPATRDMDKDLSVPTPTRDMDKDLSTPTPAKPGVGQRMTPQ